MGDPLLSSPPKAFISYSWSSPDHQQWVLSLAEQLVALGIEVILDLWDLEKGQEAGAFMERMVTDKTIGKVILICDRIYKEKADGRKSGAGIEAQIVSDELYKRRDNNKFLAVIAERDDHGEPYIPAYYTSRIYIDLSDDAVYTDKFEELVRWVFDKPLHVRPKLGAPPIYITQAGAATQTTSTDSFARRVIDASKGSKPFLSGALTDYLSRLTLLLTKMRFQAGEQVTHDTIKSKIDSSIGYRDEYIMVMTEVMNYSVNESYLDQLQTFLEAILKLCLPLPEAQSYSNWHFDASKFFVYELFLYTATLLIKRQRFDALKHILGEIYYIDDPYGRNTVNTFAVFNSYIDSFDAYSHVLRVKSARFAVVQERLHEGVELVDLIQTDLTLCLASRARQSQDKLWHPELLVGLGFRSTVLPLFARCRSRKTFNKFCDSVGVDAERFREVIGSIDNQGLNSGGYPLFPSLSSLVDIDKLGTTP